MKFIYQGGTGEVIEKKSRFIATVRKVESEEEALAFVAEMKKKYWDARHNCYAFVVGDSQQLQRCSDDGEPQGTAGRPMLEVLLHEEIHNAAVVVTRYFGGTLLGVGGLVRAYQKAAQEGLRGSVVVERTKGCLLAIATDYNGIGKLLYLAAQHKIPIVDTVYMEKVELKLAVPEEQTEWLKREVTEETSGTARFEGEKNVEFAVIDGKVEIFAS